MDAADYQLGSAIIQNKRRIAYYSKKLNSCQNYNYNQYKNTGRGYGHTPPRKAGLIPWDKAAVDLIGPWKIRINADIELERKEFHFFRANLCKKCALQILTRGESKN